MFRESGPTALHARYRASSLTSLIRAIDFVADAPGDWAFPCHKSHHTMNDMGHDVDNFIGVSERGLSDAVAGAAPGAMPMGTRGMADMGAMSMRLPPSTLPMMTGTGQFGPIEMGGMFTVMKVRRAGVQRLQRPGALQESARNGRS